MFTAPRYHCAAKLLRADSKQIGSQIRFDGGTPWKRSLDYLAQEDAHLTPQQAKRVKMTEQQRLEYKIYRAACRESNVEPSGADFLNGGIPDGVIHGMELEQNEKEWERREVMAAGR